MQGVTGTVQFAQFPGMVGTIYFNPDDIRRVMGDSVGVTGTTRECLGPTGSTGNRYVNVNYTVNANTSGKVTTEITF